jgi:hypothetical protein
VLTPLAGNGPAERQPLTWGQRARFLRLCLGYPSQWTSWLGLWPVVLMRYMSDGAQYLQAVSVERLNARPHEGRLYYEARGFSSWERVKALLSVLNPPRG